VLLRLGAATIANTPGIPAGPPGHDLKVLDRFAVDHLAPWILLISAVLLVLIAVTGRWGVRRASRLADGQGTGPADPPGPGGGATTWPGTEPARA